jgi:colanic acid biosynthesis glycosyl transferase WcaI
MKILLLNQFYPPDVAATGQLLADLAEGLVKHKHEVHVICSRRSYNGGAVKYPREEKINNVMVHRMIALGFGRGNTLGRIADYLSFYILAMWRALWLPRMDLCIALTTPPFISIVGLGLYWLKGTRLVLWTMDLYPQVPVALGMMKRESILYGFFFWLGRYLYRRSSRIISLGEIMTKRLIEAGVEPNKIVTVHNWVPREVINPVET